MALSRLTAALAAATSEVTLTAANINFDFTLVKIEPPKEYAPIGNILSAKRKDNAEHGSSHFLARQLGALFHGICPPTPKLLEAYGIRASEIAKTSKNASDPYVDTIFGEYSGIDGTSIWAAATSSRSALHVHLLATLLARMWTAPQATAIWVELVTERKKEIARRLDEQEPIEYSLVAAAGQDISRPELAAWDASVRAWLHTADDVFYRKQKQLELILKNINLPVGDEQKVFPGVIKAWVVAVETMEKLISGMPQAVQNGAMFLGLSAWHLYPDMCVFSPRLAEIRMEDPLIAKGGVISLGLSTTPRNSESNGVYWSLSLAQLQFYGRPVKVERALESGARVTFPQLNLMIFAALLAAWNLSDSEGDLAAKCVIKLVENLYPSCYDSNFHQRFLKLLKDGASAYLDYTDTDQDLKRKLIQLGRRRGQNFFYGDVRIAGRDYSTFLDLLEPQLFMQMFFNSECRIKYLRYVASRLAHDEVPTNEFIIKYAAEVTQTNYGSWNGQGDEDEQLHSEDRPATDTSQENASNSSSSSSSSTTYMTASRDNGREMDTWVQKNLQDLNSALESSDEDSDPSEEDMEISHGTSISYHKDAPEKILDYSTTLRLSPSSHNYDHQGDSADDYKPRPFAFTTAIPYHFNKHLDYPIHHRWVGSEARGVACPKDEIITFDADRIFTTSHHSVTMHEATSPNGCIYHLLLGDPEVAALYSSHISMSGYKSDTSVTLEVVHWCMVHNLLNPMEVYEYLFDPLTGNRRIQETLMILVHVAKVYDDIPNATIHVGCLDRPLHMQKWTEGILRSTDRYFYQDDDSISMDLEQIFSLIAYFESGMHDVYPAQLENVIAVSSTNSLFVWSTLIQDPYQSIRGPPRVQRILGNIGKPGLTFMLPPKEPMIRENNPESWKLASYLPFDGKHGQSFDNTSVHLSFTEYHVSMYDGSRGAHDNQISFLEAVISVRDKGQWVADIDPLLFKRSEFRVLPVRDLCLHATNENLDRDIIAVDNWDEMIDNPDGVFVIRAGNNWIARLASTLVIFQRMQQSFGEFAVTVCPEKVCWYCLQQTLQHHAYIY